MAEVVGNVKEINGVYTATDKSGNVRDIKVGDDVFRDELIVADQEVSDVISSKVVIVLNNGQEITIYPDDKILLDNTVVSMDSIDVPQEAVVADLEQLQDNISTEATDTKEADLDIEALQAGLESGELDIENLEDTAAGDEQLQDSGEGSGRFSDISNRDVDVSAEMLDTPTDVARDSINSVQTGTPVADDIEAIDTVAPTVSFNSIVTSDTTPSLNGLVDDPTATVVVNIGANSYQATNNGDGTWILADNTLPNGALAENINNINVTATDPSGNSSDANGTITLDSTAPSVTVNSITTNDTTPALSGSVDDADATVVVTVDGKEYNAVNNGNGTWTLADNELDSLSDGNINVSVKATDKLGNEGSNNGTITLDSTAPSVTVNSITTNDTTPALSGSVDDADATVVVTVDGKEYNAVNNGNGTWTLADNELDSLSDGNINVSVKATDKLGNEGSNNGTITLDSTAPSVTVNSITTNDTTPALSGSVDDADATVVVTVDGKDYNAVNNGNGTWTLADNELDSLSDGNINVSVKATDKLGNEGSNNGTITLDSTAPSVTISGALKESTTDSFTFKESFEDNDVGNGWNVVDDKDWNENIGVEVQSSGVSTKATDGSNVAELDAHPNKGVNNTDGSNVTISKDFDTSSTDTITVTLDYNPRQDNNSSSDMSVTIGGTKYYINADGTADAGVEVVDNGNGWYSLTIKQDVSGDNTTKVSLSGEGAADTVGALVDNINIVGTTKTEISTDTTDDSSPALTGTVDDADATVVVTVDGKEYNAVNNGDGTWTLADNILPDGALDEGANTISVKATDKLGNESTNTGSITLSTLSLDVKVDVSDGTRVEDLSTGGSLESWSDSGIDLFGFTRGTSYTDNNGTLNLDNANTNVVYERGKNAIGIKSSGDGNNWVGKQIGTDEAMALDLPTSVTEATVYVSRLYSNTDDLGKWEAFDSNGNKVGEGTFEGRTRCHYTREGEEQIEVKTDQPFTTLVFTTATGADTDFFVTGLSYDVDNSTYEYDVDVSISLKGVDNVDSITIADLPDGATLSAGKLNSDGSYTLSETDLNGLKLITNSKTDGDFDLSVTVNATKDGVTVTDTDSDGVDVPATDDTGTDDKMNYSNENHTYDGGLGEDTLTINGNKDDGINPDGIDFENIDALNIENVQLQKNAKIVDLDIEDVVKITDGDNEIKFLDKNDGKTPSIDLDMDSGKDGWSKTGTATEDGKSFDVYEGTSNADETVTLKIESSIDVNEI
jgi:transcriptional antiterminator Rof (Rho-off)